MTTLFVCVTCRGGGGEEERPGRELFEALEAHLAGSADGDVTVTEVACLSVCKRPCSVALMAAGKWSYVYGDLDAALHVEDVIDMVRRYGRSGDGIVPWRERPPCFRSGVIARFPPLGFKDPG